MPNESTLHLDSLQEGRRLRDFFRESGYESPTLTTLLGRVGPPSQHRRDLPLLLHQTREPNRLNTLVRWFVIGQPVEENLAREVIPEEALRLFLKSGLVTPENGSLAPAALLLPLDEMLTASDGKPKGEPRPDLVIGTTPSARALAHFTVSRKVRSALDLCCGCGLHALEMAGHSETVVAADLNPRALLFAQFNARLNGVENIEFAQGDGFAPIEGRCFDLIVSNPPFFLLPPSDLLYRDNPLLLDGFAEKLARQAPHFLNEGGFFQMILEWVEVEGQPWQQRLAAWVSQSGCDVWLIKHYTQQPIDYCHTRLRTIHHVSNEQDAEMVARWTEYYRRHKVAAMHGGMIAMRKRSGPRNWVEMEEVPFQTTAPFGDLVEAVFDAHDAVADGGDEALLALHPRLSPRVLLEQIAQVSEQGWVTRSMQLKLDHGLERVCRVDQHVAAFLAECTGQRSLAELIGELLPADAPQAEQVRAGCIVVMRQLMRRGFLLIG
jgi:SAM-dependent methyltransferase